MILQAWVLDAVENTFTHELDIDYATSIIWISRFQDIGEFELYVRASKEILDLLNNEDVFLIRDDSEYGMYIESVLLSSSAEDGDYLTIKGRSAELMLLWRVVTLRSYTSASTTAEGIIRDNLNTELIPSSIFTSDNYIPFLSLETAHGWEDYTTRQFTGKTLFNITQDLCESFGYGFKFVWNGAGFTIKLYKGTDRSYSQDENSYVIFSPEFDNLTSSEYIKDSSNYFNTAIVAGQGEGYDRTIVNVFSEDCIGFKRRTLWIDARNSSKTQSGGELTDNQYRKQLKEQGAASIAEHKRIESFEGEVFTEGSFRYGEDYFLGDKVAVENAYGIRGNATVIEITEVEDESGYRLIPTLSDWTINTIEED